MKVTYDVEVCGDVGAFIRRAKGGVKVDEDATMTFCVLHSDEDVIVGDIAMEDLEVVARESLVT